MCNPKKISEGLFMPSLVFNKREDRDEIQYLFQPVRFTMLDNNSRGNRLVMKSDENIAKPRL